MPAGECAKHPGTKLIVATGGRSGQLNFVRCPKCFAAKPAGGVGKDAAKPTPPAAVKAPKAAAPLAAAPAAGSAAAPAKTSTKGGVFGRFGFR
jgi:hypothetical protein